MALMIGGLIECPQRTDKNVWSGAVSTGKRAPLHQDRAAGRLMIDDPRAVFTQTDSNYFKTVMEE